MSTPQRKKVVICTGPEGHLSIAKSLQAWLKPDYDVERLYFRDGLFDLYLPIYQLFPGANKFPYAISQSSLIKKTIWDVSKQKYQKRVRAFLAQHQPNFTFSTHYIFNTILEEYQQETGVPFFSVIPDPWTIHPLFIALPPSRNLVFDQVAFEASAQQRPDALLNITGWFTNPLYYQKYDQQAVRRQLKLHPDQFTILITSGSEGTMMIMKLLPTLLQLKVPTQIIVACGSNQSLHRGMRVLKQLIQPVNKNSKLISLAFTTQLHLYMAAADLVVGKAGPNTLFESIALHKPFFAVTHIAGQEDGNLELILQNKLGFVEESNTKASQLLTSIIHNPTVLRQFEKPIAKQAAYNEKAIGRLKKIMRESTVETVTPVVGA